MAMSAIRKKHEARGREANKAQGKAKSLICHQGSTPSVYWGEPEQAPHIHGICKFCLSVCLPVCISVCRSLRSYHDNLQMLF